MADSTAALAQDTANLHLDEVTGERVSKSELKKRQKARQVEEKKREKAAAAPPKAEKKGNTAEMDESNLNPNVSGRRNLVATTPSESPFDADLVSSNTLKSAAAASTGCGRPKARTPTRTSSWSRRTCASLWTSTATSSRASS
jgi:hypothetical protein